MTPLSLIFIVLLVIIVHVNYSNGETKISESDAINSYLKETLDFDEAALIGIHRNGESAVCGGVILVSLCMCVCVRNES